MANIITGELMKAMMLEAAACIEEKKEEINDLNVFPVPDGDTGTNMAMTLGNCANELSKLQAPALGKVLEVMASSLLRGARGNSGVITSLLFRGMTKHLKGASEIGGKALAAAMGEGVQAAYKAVMKPAEGTILTVSRVAAEAAQKAAKKTDDCEAVLVAAMNAARPALEETQNQNPVLKKAGVVDAGGYGWLLILESMHVALTGKTGLRALFKPKSKKPKMEAADFSDFDHENITFAYCTEFIAARHNMKESPVALRAYLETIGDCVVVVDDDEIVKVHVHTDNPDKALGAGLKIGPLITVKVENMKEQLEQLVEEEEQEETLEAMGQRRIAEPEKRYGFVTVCAGAGVADLFRELGADQIVEGGQTMNPSTEDILKAVDLTPSEVVFVLPNNKNIIMASQQAAELSGKQVIVLETKTVPQGITAMLNFDPESDPDSNEQMMTEALAGVRTGSITYAARDSEFDGHPIKQGDHMALVEGKLLWADPKQPTVIKKLAEQMCGKDSAYITVLHGEGADEDSIAALEKAFQKAAPNAEINVIHGGQPVYAFIVAVE